jgi:hypothetical protein
MAAPAVVVVVIRRGRSRGQEQRTGESDRNGEPVSKRHRNPTSLLRRFD